QRATRTPPGLPRGLAGRGRESRRNRAAAWSWLISTHQYTARTRRNVTGVGGFFLPSSFAQSGVESKKNRGRTRASDPRCPALAPRVALRSTRGFINPPPRGSRQRHLTASGEGNSVRSGLVK